jgi:hypothetical protein
MFALLSLLAALSKASGTRKESADRDAAVGVVAIPAFVAAVLYTLSVADVFHVFDWLHHRTKLDTSDDEHRAGLI